MSYLLLILLGYLIGSLNPAYFLGRILKGIDVREYGTKNAGTRNVKKVLGLWPAVITAVFDLAKGLLAMYIAWKLGMPEIVIYASGYAAVLGHIFPFYLKFRGGEGSATSVAILIFLIITAVIHGWFFYTILIPLGVLALTILYITKAGEIVGMIVLPAFVLLLFLKTPLNSTLIFIGLILIQLFIVALYNIKKLHLLTLGEHKAQFWRWRTILRPLAVVFVILPFFMSRSALLYFTGSVASVFIVFDLLRLLIHRLNAYLYKKTTTLFKQKEVKQFSSMTFFLTAVFILLLAFPPKIASLAILFLIFGDLFAKFFGLLFGRHPFLSKTLEGSLAYFAFAFFVGYVYFIFASFPLWILAAGALSASATEAFSLYGIDDNFTVGLVSGAVMLALSTLI